MQSETPFMLFTLLAPVCYFLRLVQPGKLHAIVSLACVGMSVPHVK